MRPLRLVAGVAWCATLVAAALSGARAQQGTPYDIVIANGRVIDPESGLDGVRHVGISGGVR